ncbi:hypothetical protein PG999_005269 [Apiospora kogelbergensis]|uniref:Methyltransferase domain-containing protein n=1 Tax=Apiospora kogelbergensis TaxID=1337665 RepID=A0AAW0R1S0_9PEZI
MGPTTRSAAAAAASTGESTPAPAHFNADVLPARGTKRIEAEKQAPAPKVAQADTTATLAVAAPSNGGDTLSSHGTTGKSTTNTTATTNKNNVRFNAEAAAWDNNPFIQAMSAEAWRAIQNNVTCFRDSSDTGLPQTAHGGKPDVLEIGCGTGTLSLLVAPHARLVVAVDAAEGMVNQLKWKLDGVAEENERNIRLPKRDFSNVVPICVMLEDPEDPNLPPAQQQQQPNGNGDGSHVGGRADRIKFDLVISHLVLHHIPDLAPVLRTMLGCLRPGGVAALTDFEDFGPAARLFHPECKMEGVERHGVPKAAMRQLMRDVGFADVRVEVAWRARKKVEKFPGEFGAAGEGTAEQGEDMEFPFLICTGKRP